MPKTLDFLDVTTRFASILRDIMPENVRNWAEAVGIGFNPSKSYRKTNKPTSRKKCEHDFRSAPLFIFFFLLILEAAWENLRTRVHQVP